MSFLGTRRSPSSVTSTSRKSPTSKRSFSKASFGIVIWCLGLILVICIKPPLFFFTVKKKSGGFMQITRISPKHQITIPKDAFEKLRLEVGDFLEVDVTEEGLLLVPKKLISKDQMWFWTKEWQEKEKEADEAIAKGEISGPFKNANELFQHLRK